MPNIYNIYIHIYIYIYICIYIHTYILLTKITETFWSRDVTDIWVLAHFEPKNQARKTLNYIKSSCAKLLQIFSNVSKNVKMK